MTERSISQLIADLRRLEFRPDSDLGILLDYAQEASSAIQLANSNAAACMRVANERQERIDLLTEALRWALENGIFVPVVSDRHVRLGHLYCAVDMKFKRPPSHLESIFRDILGAKT